MAFSLFSSLSKYFKKETEVYSNSSGSMPSEYSALSENTQINDVATAAAEQGWLTAEWRETSLAVWLSALKKIMLMEISLLCCVALVVIWNHLLPQAQLCLQLLRCMTRKVSEKKN